MAKKKNSVIHRPKTKELPVAQPDVSAIIFRSYVDNESVVYQRAFTSQARSLEVPLREDLADQPRWRCERPRTCVPVFGPQWRHLAGAESRLRPRM